MCRKRECRAAVWGKLSGGAFLRRAVMVAGVLISTSVGSAQTRLQPTDLVQRNPLGGSSQPYADEIGDLHVVLYFFMESIRDEESGSGFLIRGFHPAGYVDHVSYSCESLVADRSQ